MLPYRKIADAHAKDKYLGYCSVHIKPDLSGFEGQSDVHCHTGSGNFHNYRSCYQVYYGSCGSCDYHSNLHYRLVIVVEPGNLRIGGKKVSFFLVASYEETRNTR